MLEEADNERTVKGFENAITTACKLSFRVRKAPTRRLENKSVPWWTQDLLILRKKTNALRRRFQRTTNDEQTRENRKLEYLTGKKTYESAIRKAKFESWKQ